MEELAAVRTETMANWFTMRDPKRHCSRLPRVNDPPTAGDRPIGREELAPDLFRELDDHPQLVCLLLLGEVVAFDRRGKAALGRETELVEIDVL